MVKSQLERELFTLSNVQSAYSQANEALFDKIFTLCSNKIDEVMINVEDNAESLDNQTAHMIASAVIGCISKGVTVGVAGKVASLSSKVVVNVVSVAISSGISIGTTLADPNLSSSAKVELQASAIKETLDDWFITNNARYSDLYADMVSSMGGLNLANQDGCRCRRVPCRMSTKTPPTRSWTSSRCGSTRR